MVGPTLARPAKKRTIPPTVLISATIASQSQPSGPNPRSGAPRTRPAAAKVPNAPQQTSAVNAIGSTVATRSPTRM